MESLGRYPVKSMRGEVAGGLCRVPRSIRGLSTGRELETMLVYQPRYRNSELMTKPILPRLKRLHLDW